MNKNNIRVQQKKTFSTLLKIQRMLDFPYMKKLLLQLFLYSRCIFKWKNTFFTFSVNSKNKFLMTHLLLSVFMYYAHFYVPCQLALIKINNDFKEESKDGYLKSQGFDFIPRLLNTEGLGRAISRSRPHLCLVFLKFFTSISNWLVLDTYHGIRWTFYVILLILILFM